MSDKIDTGGAVFPGLHPSKDCQYSHQGMTLRDHFAGLAVQGTLAGQTKLGDDLLARISYQLADEMIKARKEQS